MSGFANKVAVVTGASSGIGKATAESLAKHGSLLVICGRNEGNLNDVAKVCKQNGAKDVLIVIADFEKLSDVDKVAEETMKKFGKIDILVNNAGVLKPALLESVEMADFDWMFNINVKAMLRLTQKVMPHLIESKGCIVNVSSICSQFQFPSLLVYNMTKAAVDQFTKTIALEYAPKGVRVNAVNPSSVETNIYKKYHSSDEQLKEMYDRNASLHPLGRIGTVEEVAAAILFLASEDSAWTTGQCLILDGGRTIALKES